MPTKLTCPHCRAAVSATGDEPVICPHCGGSVSAAGSPHLAAGAPPAPVAEKGIAAGLPRFGDPVVAEREPGHDVDIRLPGAGPDVRGRALAAVTFIVLTVLADVGSVGTEFYRYTLMKEV